MIGAGSRLVAHVSVGSNVSIGQNSLLHAGVRVGDFCQIGSRVILQPNATIGGDGFAFVTPEPGSVESVRETGEVRSFNTELIRINSIGNVILEDDVFCGPSMVFTNVINPRSHIPRKDEYKVTLVRQGASIGANATVVCGATLGRYCFVGAGSVVRYKAQGVNPH